MEELNTFLTVKNTGETQELDGVHGIWAIPDATGSIGVVTLNLPRIAYQSKGDWSLFNEKLDDSLEAARSVLKRMREIYVNNLSRGFMPITRLYLGHLSGHFSTIGLVGLPEAASNFMGMDVWLEGSRRDMEKAIDIERKIVETVRKRSKEYQEMDGCLYNVEEIPAESTAYRMAVKDAEIFNDKLGTEYFMPFENGTPFYSNSIVPYYADVSIFERARWEGIVQQEFTGGVMMHLFLSETVDPLALKKLVRRICENTKVVYFSITPTLTVCKDCGRSIVGIYGRCPSCGSENVDWWSRIVGYYRPVSQWNIGKKAEFKLRKNYRDVKG